MHTQQPSLAQYNTRNLAIWSALAFQAGCINVGGFLGCHRFVSHITGLATHFGAEAGQGHWRAAFGMFTVPSFFLAGSMISAILIDRNIAQKKPGNYPAAFVSIAIILTLVALCGQFGVFGQFGTPLSLATDFSLLSLLCLASGLQNATVTSASGAVIRTTHLTGMVTDLGIGIIRVLLPYQHESRPQENKRNLMRISIIGSFVIGAFVATIFFVHGQYMGFALPALTSIALTLVSLKGF